MSKKIVILGSTGSVGTQCLEIIRKFPDDFSVLGLSAGKNFKLLKEQIQEFTPEYFFIDNYEQKIEESKEAETTQEEQKEKPAKEAKVEENKEEAPAEEAEKKTDEQS